MNESPSLRVVLTGGASGGHLFPLIAVSRALRKQSPKPIEFLYIGSKGPFEGEAMAAEGIAVKYIAYGKWRRYVSFLNVLDIFRLPIGFIQALWHLLLFLPDAIFSKGGAVSVPVVLAAWLYRIPVLTHDSDAVAGRANRFLARFVKRIAVTYPSAEAFFPREKVVLTGNPIREEVTLGNRERGLTAFRLSPEKKTLLVLGGSLGARGLNQSLLRALPILVRRDIQVIHQTGKTDFDAVVVTARELGIDVDSGLYRPVAFLDPVSLGDAYAVCDVVLSRAGAATISETAANKKAVILVPLPTAANDEQRKNAYEVAAVGGALVLEEGNLGENLLVENIASLLSRDDLRTDMGNKLSVFYHADAASRIADGVLSLIV